MSAPTAPDPALERRLRRNLEGDVLFGAFDRARYATDASVYQIRPLGVVRPRSEADVARTLQICSDAGVPVIARGAGTSQSGQPIGRGVIVDTSRWLRRIHGIDPEAGTAEVDPGVVLDRLNAALAPHGLQFPVDVATASRATLGGMAANNSAGARSIRWGMMVEHVDAVEALLADGSSARFAADAEGDGARVVELRASLAALHARHADELLRRRPPVMRNVAGYNLHRLAAPRANLAELLVGSEGTLALFTRLRLKLSPLPAHTALGVCAFPTLHAALAAVPTLVELGPSAVELMDATLLQRAREHPTFAEVVRRFVRGEPGALLLTEFTGADPDGLRGDLGRLEDAMGDLGHAGAVARARDPADQRAIWSVRRTALNLVMSSVADARPVSFVEDCVVPLDRLAEYGDRVEAVFRRYGSSGTWYAHASVGCLHVRPALDLRSDGGLRAFRAIAEEVHEIVRDLEGTHSGEHGDGIVRSEFLESMFGPDVARAFEEVKDLFDPAGILNPGKVVRPYRMDDRSLLRYGPAYGELPLAPALDWSERGGLLRAVEMCNNNGACRREQTGLMCPSYRATLDETHTTRGRANVLRLALTGQLGADALTDAAMHEALDLCVACKGCQRECPTGVDVARLKIEFLHRYHGRHGVPLGERITAHLPRLAPLASRARPLANLRNRSRLLRRATQRLTDVAADRALPAWHRRPFRPTEADPAPDARPTVDLFVDTFSTWFEPENARAALRVLDAAGLAVRVPVASDGSSRPLCCGRTYLAAGLVDEARAEATRTLRALSEARPLLGLEPSCLLTLRDEWTVLFPAGSDLSRRARALAERAFLVEEYLEARLRQDEGALSLGPLPGRAAVHGHCHQRAARALAPTLALLRRIPELDVAAIDSGCCGMAGAFGYRPRHQAASAAMAELDLLPAVRAEPEDTRIVADGTSCRAQLRHHLGREAVHAVRVLAAALEAPGAESRTGAR